MRVYAEGARVPVKSWASSLEDGALAQAKAAANLPFAVSHVCVMPDGHAGYGVPIGSVLAAEKAVVPYAIGVDIGCGVVLMNTDLTVDDLPRERLQALADRIAQYVPVGNGPKGEHRHSKGEPFEQQAHASGYLLEALESADRQLGTLGGGNHFLEVQADEDGNVYVMLHSGSRSVGKKVCDHHYRIAKRLCDLWHVPLPDRELAFLPLGTDEAGAYLADMNTAMHWAEENRRRMAGAVVQAIGEVAHGEAWQTLDVHHNYAAFENHRGRNVIVHRKGAVRARAGETVLIPGSMGTASYIAEGLGNPDSFESCQHGAGRAMSRTKAEATFGEQEFAAQVSGVVLGGNAEQARDEAPGAYKDVERVMDDSVDLVTRVTRLRPLAVVKG